MHCTAHALCAECYRNGVSYGLHASTVLGTKTLAFGLVALAQIKIGVLMR